MANDGTLTIAGDAITTAKIKDGEIANADINAGAKIDATKIADGSVTNTEFQYINSLSSNAQTQIDNINTSINGINTLADGNIYLGDASGNAQEVTLSGDATMANDGTLTIAGDAITTAKIKDGEIANADINAGAKIDATKIADGSVTNTEFQYINSLSSNAQTQIDNINTSINGINTLADGNIYLGDASGNAQEVALSGDATMANDGTLTIAGDAITTAKIKDGEIANADINAGAKIDATKIADGSVTNTEFQYINSLSSNAQTQIDNINTSINGINTLADGNIYLGDASGNAQEVALSGDATMANDGTLTIAGDAITTAKIKDGEIANADINAGAKIDATKIADGSVTNTEFQYINSLSSNAQTQIDNINTSINGINTLADGNIYLGDASGNAQEVALSGDATMANDGTLTIAGDAITTAKIKDGEIANADINAGAKIDATKIADGSVTNTEFQYINSLSSNAQTQIDNINTSINGINTLADGNIYLGDASGNAQEVALSGDATMANDGTLTIAGDAITTAKIKDGEIANADINAGAKIDATKIADGSVTNTEFQYINSLSSNAQTQIDNINTSITGINTLADGNIYLGDASGNAQEVTLSGDVTMDNTGATTIQTGAVEATAIEGLTNGQFIIGTDGTAAGNAKVTMSGDATMANNGALTIADNAITTSKIANSNVTYAKIQDVSATNMVLGRTSAGAGPVEEIPTTGSGNVVRASSPSLTTPNIGAATATSINGTSIPSSKTLVVTTDKLNALASTTSAELADIISDETGSGNLVFSTSPTLTTPDIGAATATSINKVAITQPATGATLTLADNSTLATAGGYVTTLISTAATNVILPTSGTLATLDGNETLTNKTLTSPAINTATISGGTINNATIGATTPAAATVTDLTASGTVNLGTDAIQAGEIQDGAVTYAKIQNVSATDRVLGRVSAGAGPVEEISTTGSGNVVRAISPSLTAPNLGAATATSINKVAITQPATGATLTLADNSTFTTTGGYVTKLTSTAATNVILPNSGTLATLDGNETLTNKTLTSPAINTATISGGAIDNATIGATTPAAATVTDLTSTGSITSSSLSAGIGYSAGDKVDQSLPPGPTTLSDPVNINALSGEIITNNVNSLNSISAKATFTVNNPYVSSTDVPVVAIAQGSGFTALVTDVSSGKFDITIMNIAGGTLNAKLHINFVIIKAANTPTP